MKKQRDWLGIEPIVNRPISEGLSVEVYQVYVHSIKPGDVVRVRIIQQRCKWRQGIRLSTDGGSQMMKKAVTATRSFCGQMRGKRTRFA